MGEAGAVCGGGGVAPDAPTIMRSGRCLCGRVNCQCSGAVGPTSYCHCSDCRRATGSAFNIGVRVRTDAFSIAGPIRAFTKTGDSGNPLSRHFCSECGSPIYTSSPQHPEYVFVKAGTLDDPEIPAPSHEIWTDSRVPWSRIPADIERYRRGPK